MLKAFDLWLGKRAFIPLAIWICQRTGWTQYQLSRYSWMLGYWLLIPRLQGWGIGAFVTIPIALILTVDAALSSPDTPTYRANWSDWFRRLWIVAIGIDLAIFALMAATGEPFAKSVGRLAFDLIVLLAEYAGTITTIPPREARQPKAVAVTNAA